MREAVELGVEQDVGDVLVAVDDVEAAADVEHARGVMRSPFANAGRRARLERALQMRRRRRCRRSAASRSPAVEPRHERRTATPPSPLSGDPMEIFRSLSAMPFAHALARDQDVRGAHELRQRVNGQRAADNRVGALRAAARDIVAPLLALVVARRSTTSSARRSTDSS